MKTSYPSKEYVASIIDMKGRLYYTPQNNLTRDLIEKVKKAAKTFSKNSLRIFGKSQRSKLGNDKYFLHLLSQIDCFLMDLKNIDNRVTHFQLSTFRIN